MTIINTITIRYDSVVDFTPNGNMVFTYFSGEDVKNVRGTWSEGRNKVLKMVIEKTYKGRSSEYTTQSIYIGVNDIDNDSINNVVFIGGEICDESGDNISDIDTAAGKFILSSGPTININMNEKSDKRRMIRESNLV
jgi:hypothetical protein